MIDSQSGHGSRPDQIENQLMRGVEHFRQFHPDGGQIVHVEKTAVVNFLSCNAPESEPI